MFFDFKKQIGQKPNAGYQPGAMANQPLDVFNGRWQKPGDQAEYEKFTTQGTISYGYLTQSDGVYTDASYLRLSTLALSYTLPASFTKKAGMESCSIYMNAQNVFMITNYKGVDPDIQAFGIMPASKIYTTGIIFNF
jgi:hypothetical protein